MTEKVEKTPEYLQLLDDLSKDLGLGKDGDMVKRVADTMFERIEKMQPEQKRKFSTAMGLEQKQEDKPIKRLGEFCQAVWAKEHNISSIRGKSTETIIKALGESQGSTGGFLMYEQFKPELQKLVIEDQVVRPRARTIPMAMETVLIPRIVDTTHATTIHGGVKGTYGAEAGALGTGDPSIGQLRLLAKKFSDYILVSNELLMDSPISVEPLLGVLMREGLGFFEDVDFLTGAGGDRPLGVLSSPALISTTRTTTSHLKYADAVNIWSRLFPSSQKRAVWVYSPDAFPDIAQFAVVVGTGGSSVWINGAGNGNTAVDAPPMFLFGRPMVCSEKVPALASAGSLGLYDFSYYLIGDRMQMALTTSDQVAFASDQTAFRIIERLDGQPWIASALTPHNGGSTLSAFVTVAA